MFGAAAVTTECQRSTGETSQKRVRTVSEVISPPWAIRDGSKAQRVHATKAPIAAAAPQGTLCDGDIEMNAKNAIKPVAKTAAPLQNCGGYA